MAKGRRTKVAAGPLADPPAAEPIIEVPKEPIIVCEYPAPKVTKKEPEIYRFERPSESFIPAENTNLAGIAHTIRYTAVRDIPNLPKNGTKGNEQIYAITRNGRELYFKIPSLPFETVKNLWAAAGRNISVEDFLIELQTINGVRPIIFHMDYRSLD